jgi:hypothetical protein
MEKGMFLLLMWENCLGLSLKKKKKKRKEKRESLLAFPLPCPKEQSEVFRTRAR